MLLRPSIAECVEKTHTRKISFSDISLTRSSHGGDRYETDGRTLYNMGCLECFKKMMGREKRREHVCAYRQEKQQANSSRAI